MDTKQKETDIETAVQMQIKQPDLEKNCENLMRVVNERTRQNFKESRLEKRLNRKLPKNRGADTDKEGRTGKINKKQCSSLVFYFYVGFIRKGLKCIHFVTYFQTSLSYLLGK
jgi:hypothetical protein